MSIGIGTKLATVTMSVTALSSLGLGAPAFADYGPASQHQVEISANLPSNLFGPGTGGGIWLWIQLSGSPAGGTGDYQGADCLHHTPLGPTGAVPDSGSTSWSSDGATITITGVTVGGTVPVTITVPATDGHYTTDVASVFPGLVPTGTGTAHVEVAP